MRTIRFKLLASNVIEMQSSARTFSELKREISNNSNLAGKISFGSVQLIDKDTKAVFGAIDDAVLPEGDCLFFVVPLKTKSGIKPNLDSMSLTELQTLADKIMEDDEDAWIDTDQNWGDLCSDISDYYDNLPEIEHPLDAVIEKLQGIKSDIDDTIEELNSLKASGATFGLDEASKKLEDEMHDIMDRMQ